MPDSIPASNFIEVTDSFESEHGGCRYLRKIDPLDRDCLIIRGDRREELNDMPKDKLLDWYRANIDGNKISAHSILDVLRKDCENK